MKKETENSGIDNTGVPWGAHFCQFYQTNKDLMDIIIPYLKAGLENNEVCIWIMSQTQTAEETKKALRIAFPDIDIFLRKGRIELIPCANWYVVNNVFDRRSALKGLVERVGRALASGYNGLRVVEDICRLEEGNRNDFVIMRKDWTLLYTGIR